MEKTFNELVASGYSKSFLKSAINATDIARKRNWKKNSPYVFDVERLEKYRKEVSR